MSPIYCIVVHFDGVYYFRSTQTGQVLARRLGELRDRGADRVEDMRRSPPYAQILPCPYCGVEEDRGHNPIRHVDPTLGTPIAEVAR